MKSEDKNICRFCNNELACAEAINDEMFYITGIEWTCTNCGGKDRITYCFSDPKISENGISILVNYQLHFGNEITWIFYVERSFTTPYSEIVDEKIFPCPTIITFDYPLDITPDNVEEKAKLYMLFS